MHAERAQKFVGVQCFGSKDFGEFAATDAAMHFKLPEPVTRMHKADGERQITLGFRRNRRDTVFVK